MGLAQPSVDYDVDSNPEGWTERLRVKGLRGLWALARWIHYKRPRSLFTMQGVFKSCTGDPCTKLGYAVVELVAQMVENH